MPVQCKDCGFLALRKGEDWSLGEADSEYRQTGALSDHAGRVFRNLPICFALAFNLQREYEETCNRKPQGVTGPGGAVKFVLHSERKCEEFVDWQQGLTPKEHLDMQILERQQKWQVAESQRQRDWQATESEKAETRHRETVTEAIKAARSNERSQWGAGIIAAIAALLGVWLGGWLNKPPQIIVQPAPVLATPIDPARGGAFPITPIPVQPPASVPVAPDSTTPDAPATKS